MQVASIWKRRIRDVRQVHWLRLGVEILGDKLFVLPVVVVKNPLLALKEVVVGPEEKCSFNGSANHLSLKEAVDFVVNL